MWVFEFLKVMQLTFTYEKRTKYIHMSLVPLILNIVISRIIFVLIFSLMSFLKGYSPLGSPGTKWLKSEVLKNPVLVMVAEKLGKTPAQVALRWGIQTGHSVLPKSTNEARIKQNLDVYDWSIPDDMLIKLSEIEQARTFVVLFLFSDYL